MTEKQYVEPGTEEQALSFHKRLGRYTLTLVEPPNCCGGAAMIRVVPAPFLGAPIGSATVWANVYWSQGGQFWISVVYNAGKLGWNSVDDIEEHRSLNSAMRHAWRLVGQHVPSWLGPESMRRWRKDTRELPDCVSLETTTNQMRVHEEVHVPYWRSIEELDDRDPFQDDSYDDLDDGDYYDDYECLEPVDDYQIMI